VFGNLGLVADVALHGQQSAHERAGFGLAALARHQQISDLGELLADEDADVGHRLGRYRQHALGQVIGQPLAED
jgi:hypothetical protein